MSKERGKGGKSGDWRKEITKDREERREGTLWGKFNKRIPYRDKENSGFFYRRDIVETRAAFWIPQRAGQHFTPI